jgi:hypothetical protein
MTPLADVAVAAGADAAVVPSAWVAQRLPDEAVPATRFAAVRVDGVPALRIQADRSYGSLSQAVADGAGRWVLAWRWRVDQPNPRADARTKAGDDSPAKVCVSFDLPLAAVPLLERQLLRLARVATGKPLPAATVCYQWDAALATGQVLPNIHTRRVRQIVLRGAGTPSGTWFDERRDLAADFQAAFAGEASGPAAVLAVIVGGDADSTRGQSVAHVARLRLEPAGP